MQGNGREWDKEPKHPRIIVNSSLPGQNVLHFADNNFKCIFFNGNISILIKNSLKTVPKRSVNNIPSLVQIMAWRRPGDKPLSELMFAQLTNASMRHYGERGSGSQKNVTALRQGVTSLRYLKNKNKTRLSRWLNSTKPGSRAREISETNENRLSGLAQLQNSSFLTSNDLAWLNAKSSYPPA